MAATALSEFIRANTERIVAGWEAFARNIPSAQHLGIDALRDHAVGMLLTIAEDLEKAQTADQQVQKSRGQSPLSSVESEAHLHGAAREKLGFRVTDELAEFRALRANVLRLWLESASNGAQTASDDLMRFNEAIDQALSESVTRYSMSSERNRRLFDTFLSSLPDPSYILSLAGTFIYGNESLARLYGLSSQALVGKSLFDLGAAFADELQQQIRHVIETLTTCRSEVTCAQAEGQTATYEYLLVPVLDTDGAIEAIIGSARDITERKASEESARTRANYDFLTTLPNRSLFGERLEWEIGRSRRTGLPLALLFIDLDGFKEINDRLGHEAGDLLLQQAAQRIRACVRGTDTVARLGGDEFTVILTEVRDIPHLEILAQEILDALSRAFPILQQEVRISGSIGITVFPQDADTPEGLIRNADQAMYRAKHSGRNRFNFYTAELGRSTQARSERIAELRQALVQHQLAVYYQPIVSLATEEVTMAEALLRWQHPSQGLLHPSEFVALAEEADLLGQVDEWVLGEALAHARAWSAFTEAGFQVSINCALGERVSKAPPMGWDRYWAALERAGKHIALEIREEFLLSQSGVVTERLKRLQTLGVPLGIDDFGTGPVSLPRLKACAAEYLKIDRAFVQALMTSADSRALVETMILMAHKLGIKVIALGVETPEQKDWLKSAACDYAQGYLFSHPLPEHDFEQLLQARAHRA